MVEIDKIFCASSFLMFRAVHNENVSFSKKKKPNIVNLAFDRIPVSSSDELIDTLRLQVNEATADGAAALALSGGIDSAVLAKFMPQNSTAYTFKCIAPGIQLIDETAAAARFAKINGLKHEVIEVCWEDMKEYSSLLMRHKGAPIHSIEVQIYKAALRARKSGFRKLIFGENADIIYGGMDGLLSKDWLFGEFVDRYSYVMPYKVLKNYALILDPFREFEKDGRIDAHDFINKYFRQEALGTYNNACDSCGIKFVGPFSKTYMNAPMDYTRIRSGNTKYLIREAFSKLYPGFEQLPKTPMPRPMNEWMKDWCGPVRNDFLAHCSDNMSGDQKWMIYALEQFLDILDVEGDTEI